MKKLFCVLLCMTLVLGLAACGGDTPTTDSGQAGAATDNTQTTDSGDSAGDGGSGTVGGGEYMVGGGSSGGVYYALSTVLAQHYNKTDLGGFSAQPTTGSGQNVLLMQNGDMEFAMVAQTVAADAVEGIGSFEGAAFEDLRVMYYLYPAVFQQLVREGSGITDETGLFGAKLVVGGPGSGDVATATEIYGSFGMTFDDFTPEYVGTNEGVEQMKDGHVDGVIAATPLPFSAFIELTSANKAYLIPLSQATIDALCSGDDARYFPATIPAGTYSNQTEDMATVANGSYFCTTADMDEELVYQMTKSFWENLDEIKATHASVIDLTLEDAMTGVGGTLQLHPGAARYYQEMGILD